MVGDSSLISERVKSFQSARGNPDNLISGTNETLSDGSCSLSVLFFSTELATTEDDWALMRIVFRKSVELKIKP
jgi:hypothetical protein